METAVENWPRRYARLSARSGKARKALLYSAVIYQRLLKEGIAAKRSSRKLEA
jgi:hypothetical protein